MPHRPYLSFVIALAFAACSDQGEGDRCDQNSGNKDCASGLFCVPSQELADKMQGDRCCPEVITANTDSRCRRGGTTNTGGSAGMSAAGGAGAGGESTGGAPGGGSAGLGGVVAAAGTAGSGAAPCQYNSDCTAANEICGPTGHCQVECNFDKDCAPPLVCDRPNHKCVAASVGGAGGTGP
jgi:hypothetical protein